MKLSSKIKIRAEQFRMIFRALSSTRHPILAHLIPIRRCNLACAYCNEYDAVSAPVPLPDLERRIDKLASLGTSVITLSGGEPTLHPQLDEVIRQVRQRRMIAGLITNGYFLTPERIERLNQAGLQYLQISIDNVRPDEVSKKSLRVLDSKLQNLSRYAEFYVNINSVIGGGIRNPGDALVVSNRAIELGFTSSLGIIHDGGGMLKPLSPSEMRIQKILKKRGKWNYARLNGFQNNLALGRPNEWRCRAGGRYLYVCEDGKVHYCSQQRGYPNVPLEQYTLEDVRREFYTVKSCAPYCTVACVQQVAMLDNWRAPQSKAPYGVRQTGPQEAGG
jgi:MoaA/NifB/PqqE/SkfB family radical SAM enzyme